MGRLSTRATMISAWWTCSAASTCCTTPQSSSALSSRQVCWSAISMRYGPGGSSESGMVARKRNSGGPLFGILDAAVIDADQRFHQRLLDRMDFGHRERAFLELAVHQTF